jgi:hypothetical protein
MTFPRSFTDSLRQQVERAGTVTMTIDEIISAAQSTDFVIRTRWFWMAHRAGGPGFDDFLDAGLTLTFFPDERGRRVESVTFSLSPGK